MEDAYVAKEESPRKGSGRRGTRKASTVDAMNRRASRLEEINQRIEMSKQNIQQQYQQQQQQHHPQVHRPSSPLHPQQQMLLQQHQQQKQQQQEEDHFKMPIRKQSLAVNFHVSPTLLSSMGLSSSSSKGASVLAGAVSGGGGIVAGGGNGGVGKGRLYVSIYSC